MLLNIDLDADYNQLKIDLTETKSELKKTKITKRLKLIESFILSKNKPEWMILKSSACYSARVKTFSSS